MFMKYILSSKNEYQHLETQTAYYKSKFLLMVSQPNGNDGVVKWKLL